MSNGKFIIEVDRHSLAGSKILNVADDHDA